MKKTIRQTKIEFMDRLLDLSLCYEDLMQFLIDEKLISTYEISTLKDQANKATMVMEILELRKKEEKLLLLDYEWLVLPVERLKLTVITERNSREFVFNY